MSEPLYASILIGGKLPLPLLKSFLNDVREETNELKEMPTSSAIEGMDWLNETRSNESGSPFIEADGSLQIIATEANWGEFKSLEKFCRDNNLSYIRRSDGSGELSPEVSWFTPSMQKEITLLSNNSGYISITKDWLSEALHEVQNFAVENAPLLINSEEESKKLLAHWSLKNPWDKLEALKALIENDYPTPPQSTGPFSIV